jgi:hypothetical protein
MLSARQEYNKETGKWELYNRFTFVTMTRSDTKWENVKFKKRL